MNETANAGTICNSRNVS